MIYCELIERRAGAHEQACDFPTIEIARRVRVLFLETTNCQGEWRLAAAARVDISDISMCSEEECDHIDAGITNATGCIM